MNGKTKKRTVEVAMASSSRSVPITREGLKLQFTVCLGWFPLNSGMLTGHRFQMLYLDHRITSPALTEKKCAGQ